jgi:hypothetical protein
VIVVFAGHRIVAEQEAASDDSVHDMDDGNFVGSKDFHAS